MNLLLDTHALLWWLGGDRALGAAARAEITRPSNDVWVSAATAWEMSIKRAAGKLATPDDLVVTLDERGVRSLPIALDHAIAAAFLPRHHADPFDRMLVAQAMLEGMTIVTHDAQIAAYGVPTLPAR